MRSGFCGCSWRSCFGRLLRGIIKRESGVIFGGFGWRIIVIGGFVGDMRRSIGGEIMELPRPRVAGLSVGFGFVADAIWLCQVR